MHWDEHIAQLEDEVRRLKEQLEQGGIEKKERFQALDNMPDGALYRSVRNKQTNELIFDYVSETWEKISGVSAELTLADLRNVFVNMPPEDVQLLMKNMLGGNDEISEKYNVEVRYHHPITKKLHWFQISSYPHREGDKVVADGFVFDITARKEMEQKLLIEKNRLEALGSNLPNVAFYQFVHDFKTQKRGFSYLSGSWESVTGIPIEVGLRNINALFATIHPDDLPLLIKEMSHTVEEKDSFYIEVRATIHGRNRWAQLAARRRVENDLFIADGIIMDITERKEIEIELNKEKNRLEALGNNLPNAVLYQYIRDVKAQNISFTYVSGSWESITGIPAEVAMNDFKALFAVVHPDDLPLLIQQMGDLTKDKFFIEIRVTVRGNPRWLQFAARRFFNGEAFISDGIIQDITDRKAVEHELILAKDRAEESDRLKSAFLANMSHDIRSPMNGVVGFASLIQKEATSPRIHRYAQLVNDNCHLLLHLLDDIIDISKIESGQLKIISKECNINRLLGDGLLLFEELLKKRDNNYVEIIFEDNGLDENIVVDSVRLMQVITNLMSNAIKFTDKGFICFGYTRHDDNHLLFYVKDTGIGIPSDEIKTIFGRFHQVEEHLKRNVGGTGIGLAISQSLVELMGGKIWVESTEDVGSMFYFTIPYMPVTSEYAYIIEETQNPDDIYKPLTGK